MAVNFDDLARRFEILLIEACDAGNFSGAEALIQDLGLVILAASGGEWKADLHPRYPVGHPKAGQFMSKSGGATGTSSTSVLVPSVVKPDMPGLQPVSIDNPVANNNPVGRAVDYVKGVFDAIDKKGERFALYRAAWAEELGDSIQRIGRDIDALVGVDSSGQPYAKKELDANELILQIKKTFKDTWEHEKSIIDYDAKADLETLRGDENVKAALSNNGIDPEDYFKAAERMVAAIDDDNRSVKSAHELFNRKEDVQLYFERARRMVNLDKKVGDKKPDDYRSGNATALELQAHKLAIEGEIKFGAAVDKFLASGRGEKARKQFLDEIAPNKQSTLTPLPMTKKRARFFQMQMAKSDPTPMPSTVGKQPNLDNCKQAIEDAQRLIPIDLEIEYGNIAPGPFAVGSKNPSTWVYDQMSDNCLIRGDGFVNMGEMPLDQNTVLLHESTHVLTSKADLTKLTEAFVKTRASGRNDSDPERQKLRKSNINYVNGGADRPTDRLRGAVMGGMPLNSSGQGVLDTDMSVPYGSKIYEVLNQKFNSEVLTVGLESVETRDGLESLSINDRDHLLFTLRTIQPDVVNANMESIKKQYGWTAGDKSIDKIEPNKAESLRKKSDPLHLDEGHD
ncbi:MAG TPA: hypothetical protein V6D29_15335 [Leptolyngbyaceae cyanobacterium]